MIDAAIHKLIAYALDTGLIERGDEIWAANTLLEGLGLTSYTKPEGEVGEVDLNAVLNELMDDAHARGALPEDSIAYRDLYDTMLMGRLTPRPAQVAREFAARYAQSPSAATDWYYKFSQDTNYIRRDRIAKDMKWVAPTEYGDLDITINRRPESARVGLSPLPALRRERGLCGQAGPPRQGQPPHGAYRHQQLPLVFAVLPLCVLQ